MNKVYVLMILIIAVAINFTMCSSESKDKAMSNVLPHIQNNSDTNSFYGKFISIKNLRNITLDSITKLESKRVNDSLLSENEILNNLCDIKNSDCLMGDGCAPINYVPLYVVNYEKYYLFVYCKRFNSIKRHYILMTKNKTTGVLSKILLCTHLPTVRFSYLEAEEIIIVNKNEYCNRIMKTKVDSILTLKIIEKYKIAKDGNINLMSSESVEEFIKD